MPFIIRWCKLNNQLEWLYPRLDNATPCKQIVYEFCVEFMPELIPWRYRIKKPVFGEESEKERIKMMRFGDIKYSTKVRKWLK